MAVRAMKERWVPKAATPPEGTPRRRKGIGKERLQMQ